MTGVQTCALPISFVRFAPADPWDGRKPYEWRSRWEREAKRSILVDGLYLTAVLLLCPVVLFVLDTEKLKSPLSLTPHASRELALYGSAWIAGMLGGAVFALKWFYHSVARGKWHIDRRAWRIFTPVVSGALAFGTGALFISEVLPIFNPTITRSIGGVTGLSSTGNRSPSSRSRTSCCTSRRAS